SSANVVEGNWVGLTAAGNSTLPTFGAGVSLFSAPSNQVGGPAPGAGNVIDGQTFDGVAIDSSGHVAVLGNRTGTDPTGTFALRQGRGIFSGSEGTTNVTSGGPAAGAGNVISGNLGDGIRINPQVGGGIAIQGNLIGTDATGKVALPNDGTGVYSRGNGVT